MPRRSHAPSVLFAMALATLSAPAAGQMRRPSGPAGGWAPIEIGVHGGYDYTSRGSIVGAQMRMPLHPSGYVELVPNGDVIFLPQLKEYTAGADMVAISGGRRGGLYAGGGLTWRRALYSGVRATRRAPTIVVGARSPALFGTPFGTQVEVRWIRVESAVKPKFLTFGVNFPLWGWGEGSRR